MLPEHITLNCSNGFTLYAKDGMIVIHTRKADESIPVSQIQSVTVKEPGALSPGKFIFSTAQANSSAISVGFGVMAGIGAEKSFFFPKDDLMFAYYMRDYILNYEKEQRKKEAERIRLEEQKRRKEEERRAEQRHTEEAQANKPANKQVVSVVDEIRGLKQLLDEGILTDEEFTFKKRQLLGMP